MGGIITLLRGSRRRRAVREELADRRPDGLPVGGVRGGDLALVRLGVGLAQPAVPDEQANPQVDEEPCEGLLDTEPEVPVRAEQHRREHRDSHVAVESVQGVVDDLRRRPHGAARVDLVAVLAVGHQHSDDEGAELQHEVPPERVVPVRVVRQAAREGQQHRRRDRQVDASREEQPKLVLAERQQTALSHGGENDHGDRGEQQTEHQAREEPVPSQPSGVPEQTQRVVVAGDSGDLHGGGHTPSNR